MWAVLEWGSYFLTFNIKSDKLLQVTVSKCWFELLRRFVVSCYLAVWLWVAMPANRSLGPSRLRNHCCHSAQGGQAPYLFNHAFLVIPCLVYLLLCRHFNRLRCTLRRLRVFASIYYRVHVGTLLSGRSRQKDTWFFYFFSGWQPCGMVQFCFEEGNEDKRCYPYRYEYIIHNSGPVPAWFWMNNPRGLVWWDARVSTEVDFWNSTEVGICLELVFFVRGISRNFVCEIPRMFGKKCTEFEANTGIT